MKRFLIRSLVIGILLGFGIWDLGFVPAGAAPTIMGTTGLIRMPTADILQPKEFNIGLDYGAEVATTAVTKEGIGFYKINLGAFKGLELGVVGRTEKGESRVKEGVFVNMKYSLSSDDSMYPLLLAIGVENLASSSEADAYLVATKYFKGNYKLHFGTLFDFPQGKFRPLGMAGLTVPVAGNTIVVIGEVFAGETLFQVDAGLRFHLMPSFALTISGLNLTNNLISKDAQSAYVGFSWENPL